MDKVQIEKTEDGRRIFYVDIGDMPIDQALEYLDKIKEELGKK